MGFEDELNIIIIVYRAERVQLVTESTPKYQKRGEQNLIL